MPVLKDFLSTYRIEIVARRVLCIHAMHQRLALCIGFNAEGRVAVTVRLHLLGKEGLSLANIILDPRNGGGAIRPIIWQKVDQTHGARWAHIQSRHASRLGRRARVIAGSRRRRRNVRCRRGRRMGH